MSIHGHLTGVVNDELEFGRTSVPHCAPRAIESLARHGHAFVNIGLDVTVAERAKSLGIASLPAVVIDGKVASCCAGRGVDIEALRAAGLGRPN
jgi:hypothetical protein